MLKFDIHGVIVDLYNGSNKLRNYLQTQLEYFLCEKNKEPDIKIDVVPRLVANTNLKSIGTLAEFGKKEFFVRLHGNRVLIPFHNIGSTITIKSESSVPVKRILESIIEPAVYFKLLTKNIAFIHSSAVFFNEAGIIFPAWTHAGKTEILFEFMKKGAHFMSDDWTFVSDSEKIYAYPRPILIHPHTFQHVSEPSRKFILNDFVLRKNRLHRKSSLSQLEKTYGISVYDVFPNVLIRKTCTLDIIVCLLRYKGKNISLVEEDLDVLVERIIAVTKYARMHYFLPLYSLYKFAFPQKRNPVIDNAENVERKILRKVLRGKPIYSFKIPLIANPSKVCDNLLEMIF